MRRLNSIKLEWRSARRRPELVTGEFVVDDVPLLEYCERTMKSTYDLVSPIGWTKPEYEKSFAERLLLRKPALLSSGRRELLVCPECADLGCGCISADVSTEGDDFVWSGIGYENNYDAEMTVIFPMGGFRFSKSEFLHQIQSHFPDVY